MKFTALILTSFLIAAYFPLWAQSTEPYWQHVPTGTQASLRGISSVDDSVCWVGGSEGVVCRTKDGGKTWQRIFILPEDSLDFRDVEALDADRAILMSAGPGETSRIFLLDAGGEQWQEVLVNKDPKGFFNGMAFWDDKRGILAGDPIDEYPFFLQTQDGGKTWQRIPPSILPTIKEGEYGFAASGSHITTQGKKRFWMGTGGEVARVFYTDDAGESWSVHPTPIIQGKPSTGIFSLDFRSKKRGIAVGGDYTQATATYKTLMRTRDGGTTWELIEGQGVPYASSVRFMGRKVVAVGSAGSYISMNAGKRWQPLAEAGFHALSISKKGKTCWASGSGGRVARLIIPTED